MNKHPYDKDYDTTTGLPRKLGWKVAIWMMGLMQLIAIAYLSHIQRALDDMNTRLSRVEGKMNMTAHVSPQPVDDECVTVYSASPGI